MLKFYLKSMMYELVENDKLIKMLDYYNTYVIMDESDAIISKSSCPIFFNCDQRPVMNYYTKETLFGKKAVIPGYIEVKEKEHPNAEIMLTVSYIEYKPKFGDLINLPVADVIAYIKQELSCP